MGIRRTPELQSFLDTFVENAGIEQDFVDASEHNINCRCDICLDWWTKMGPDEDWFGPFSKEEVEEHCKKNNLPIFW